MYAFLYVLYFVVLSIYLFDHIRKYKITTVSVFLGLQAVMFFGIIMEPNITTPVVRKLSLIYIVAMLFFLAGVSLSNLWQKYRSVNNGLGSGIVLSEDAPTKLQMLLAWLIFAVSVLLSVYLFAKAGGNLLWISIVEMLKGKKFDLYSARMAYTNVRFVGYIYQFRAILIPILSTFFLWGTKPAKDKNLIYNLIFFASFFFVLGTGQRNAFVFFWIFVVIYLFNLVYFFKKRVIVTQLLIMIIISIVLMFVLTIANSRVAEYQEKKPETKVTEIAKTATTSTTATMTTGTGTTTAAGGYKSILTKLASRNTVAGAAVSLLDRFMGINSRSAITAFQYIDKQDTVWGYDWWMIFLDVLPGKSNYTSVDRFAFEIVYGNQLGTMPPCIWGSAWYNWSYWGITVFPLILGFLYQGIYWSFKRKPVDRVRLFLYSAQVVFYGIWSTGAPVFLFNNGAITVSILSVILCVKMDTVQKIFKPRGIKGSKP